MLYQVQLLEACSLQIAIGFEGKGVKGVEVKGAVPEDMAMDVMWMR
jgi:hypothetical protein